MGKPICEGWRRKAERGGGRENDKIREGGSALERERGKSHSRSPDLAISRYFDLPISRLPDLTISRILAGVNVVSVILSFRLLVLVQPSKVLEANPLGDPYVRKVAAKW